MSPHILIDKMLEGFDDVFWPENMEALVQHQITTLYTGDAISLAEFNHYCERLNRAIARRPGRAA